MAENSYCQLADKSWVTNIATCLPHPAATTFPLPFFQSSLNNLVESYLLNFLSDIFICVFTVFRLPQNVLLCP